ncbi:NBR1-Ig-like domain-containing protein [Clostridium omnivorum]|uniref:Next to BRCA1 central domain-containing protein n=1 Tax=Clostridium omnivorum TaxID=1604902 RepID=A0ABQ5N3D2_9CLOT|nr:NBR1-Ig-like domain-containing protein [Clostridium sp. E14]GLC29704.1 hypothetical protein bsdE14_11140 [Clostridium sp. E14]
MRLKKLTAFIACFFLLTSIILTPDLKVQAATTSNIYYTVDSNVTVGQEFNIYVNAENISDLYGASIDLKYDTTMIKVTSVKVGTAYDGLVSTSSNTSGTGADYFTLSSIDQTNGTVSIAATLLGDTHTAGLNITASKSLFVIRATALKAGNLNLAFVNSDPTNSTGYVNSMPKISNSSSESTSFLSENTSVSIYLANNAEIVSNTIPDTMEPGKQYSVNIVVKNTGSNTWTASKYYKLGAVGESDPFYNSNRIYLPGTDSIAPSASKTFTFTMTAPASEGTYTSDWQMVQDGVAWFGPKLAKTVTVKKAPVLPNNAEIVSNTIPDTMEPGKQYSVNIVVKNTGSNTWTALNKYRLGAVGESDPFYSSTRIYLDSTDSIAPGASKTFALTMTAPASEGTYTSDWQMVQDGVAWFGPKLAKTVTVKKAPVLPNNAEIVSNTIPDTMEPGKQYSVNIVVKNTGSNTWTALNKYRLGAAGESDPFYSSTRIYLDSTDSIAPGASKTFAFTMTAPASEGTYTSDWQMVQDGVAWFGSKLAKTVTVKKAPVLPNNAEIVSNTIPDTMEPGKQYSVTIVVKNTGSNTWSALNKHRLGAVGESDPFYSSTRIYLDSTDSIAPGASKTFALTMTAPASEGTYASDWQMVQDGVAWFGSKLAKTVTVKKAPVLPNNAEIVSNTIPDTMEPGKQYSVTVVVKNTGSNTWSALNKYRLGAIGDTDPFYSFNRISMDSTDSIVPGASKTFTLTMTAPASEGTYTSDWQMVQDGVAWFGSKLAKTVTVKKAPVLPNNAEIVSNTIPDIMEPGKQYSVTIVVKNTGSNTWSALNKYRLGAIGDTDPFYSSNRISMDSTDSIVPGASKTFTFTMTAPAVTGTYTSDWQMVQDGVAWFGSKLVKTITVN